jgi:hypothetical protein
VCELSQESDNFDTSGQVKERSRLIEKDDVRFLGKDSRDHDFLSFPIAQFADGSVREFGRTNGVDRLGHYAVVFVIRVSCPIGVRIPTQTDKRVTRQMPDVDSLRQDDPDLTSSFFGREVIDRYAAEAYLAT